MDSEDVDGLVGISTDSDISDTDERSYILTTSASLDNEDVVVYKNIRYEVLNSIGSTSAILGLNRYVLREERE